MRSKTEKSPTRRAGPDAETVGLGRCQTEDVYPPRAVLEEIGRITIAGSRLDLWMGVLWSHLDRDVDEVEVRRKRGKAQTAAVRQLAQRRLEGDLKILVLQAAADADAVRERRNEIVHQDWILRGRDAVRPISDFAHLRGEEMIAYQIEWEREAKESADWQRVPRDSLDVVGSQAFDELRDVERELAGVTNRVTGLTFQVASARDAGVPPGWVKDEGL